MDFPKFSIMINNENQHHTPKINGLYLEIYVCKRCNEDLLIEIRFENQFFIDLTVKCEIYTVLKLE